jgi:hypothetical protein
MEPFRGIPRRIHSLIHAVLVASFFLGAGPGARGQHPSGVEAEVKCQGVPTPGARIAVGLDGPVPPGTTYAWTQVEGPTVPLEDASGPKIHLTIPAGADRLVFLLAVKSGADTRTLRVTVPVQTPQSAKGPVADAGDDLIGLVGRRITLSGSASRPSGRVAAYRWLQLGGPKVVGATTERAFYTFTPRVPGIYRFVLLVAADDAISEPDEVEVVVGEAPNEPDPSSGRGGTLPATFGLLIDAAMQRSGSLSGRAVATKTAEALDAIAERTDLYSTFESLVSEQVRRLDLIIPQEPQARAAWTQAFGVLGDQIVTRLLPLGLDLRVSQGAQVELNAAQKDCIKSVLHAAAREFRSRAEGR